MTSVARLSLIINDNSSFPSYLWAENPSSNIRTTNAPEAFHRDFNSQFDISHPNLLVYYNQHFDRNSRGNVFKDK
ncbi:Uncharacterized protein FWK35_00009747 [Aphis craccivora]|uniref:Uncharacterized protein n=1 Tax=Aphis craccivora TaxID=307492 RepID=A0A6G0YXE4_APHCR|nr:Uncharacterized protein FWK35_00009747 [Aphis craccivora]